MFERARKQTQPARLWPADAEAETQRFDDEDIPPVPQATGSRPAQKYPTALAQDAATLTVPEKIEVGGRIGGVEKLVVHGVVELDMDDLRELHIAATGRAKGALTVLGDADIDGAMDGDLAVKGTLTVRSTGVVTAKVRYGKLAIEPGGQIVGQMQVIAEPGSEAAATQAEAGPQASGPVDDNGREEISG